MIRLMALASASTVLLLGALALSSRGTPVVQACSIGNVTLEYASFQADAAAIVYVESVGGPENSEPTLPPAGPQGYKVQRAQIFDLTGFSASLRVHVTVFGDMPSVFTVDATVRSQMEKSLRRIESGEFLPCALDAGIARYLSGHYYLVFFEETPEGWATYFNFNYRLDGNDLLSPQWPKPDAWPLYLQRPTYDRFFPTLAAWRQSPWAGPPVSGRTAAETPPSLTPVPPHEELWMVMEPRVPLQTVVDLIGFVRAQPSITPPATGDAGLRH